jgi:transketolase
MAMAERFDQGLLPGAPLAHRVWVIVSDGDLEEGISSEASSLAGTQKLGHLNVIWDDNRISIEGDTAVAFTEDVCARYRAYGWDVHEVDMLSNGDINIAELYTTLIKAANNTDLPSFIRVRTTIAWPAPHAQGTSKSHGSALGPAEVSATKVELGLDPDKNFQFDETLLANLRHSLASRAQKAKSTWNQEFAEWKASAPDSAALLDRLMTHKLPESIDSHLPSFEGISSMATRKASGLCINGIATALPELWGGSADLAESNNTWIDGSPSFLPYFSDTTSPFGRNIHFGIREHAMGAALNGIALDGLTRPFGGTFLVFSDYMRGSVRLSALMQTPVTFIWTHDSIGLGEDGPTHQPVEHLWSLRGIPGLNVVRPADAHETAAAWSATLSLREPTGLILTRQDLPVFTTPSRHEIMVGVAKGAYIVASDPTPDVILIATGSEVSVALAAREILSQEGISSRVISMPCTEWFDRQPPEYQESILPRHISARVAVEAGATFGWYKYVGTNGVVVGIDKFGASASAPALFELYNITPEAVAIASRQSIKNSSDK